MSLFVHIDYEGPADFPIKDAGFLIEDNVGDRYPVHVHFGKHPGSPYQGLPNIRLHFTYEEFLRVCKDMERIGRL